MKRQISAGKYLDIIRCYLIIANAMIWPFPRTRLAKLILRARVFLEYEKGASHKAEDIILRYSQRANPPVDVVRRYIANGVNRGDASKAQRMLEEGKLSAGNRSLLKSATLRAAGQLQEALIALDSSAIEPGFRKHAARARRSIFHQQKDNLSIAIDGLAFFEAEPNYIDFKFLITIAAAAENVEREDLFATALGRIMHDIKRVEDDEKLAVRHMRDLVTAKLSLFDLDGAIRFLQRPYVAGRPGAKELLTGVNTICAEVSSFSKDVESAHTHILGRMQKTCEVSTKVSVVMSAAAFRSNVVDYPGFRSDIRFAFGEIIGHLKRLGISYDIKSRIKTHGNIRLEHPYFSYHTISNNDYGCHLKETDRPSLFSFDTAGYAGWSRFSQMTAIEITSGCMASTQAVDDFFTLDKQRVIGGNISKYGQPPATAVERLPKRYIFVALQILADAVSQNAFMTPFAMIDEIIQTARVAGISVVIKRHPMCSAPEVTAYLSEVRSDPRVFITSSSIHPLIEQSDAVCVVNSGVGSEALLHEKPVYVFGRADYMAACFICREPGDFSRAFIPGNSRLSSSELRRFWWMYRKHYAVDLRDRSKAAQNIHAAVDRHLKRFDIL